MTLSKRLALGVLISLLPMTLWANSYVFNPTKYPVWVYWTAAGCGGVQIIAEPCVGDKNVFVSTVCEYKRLQTGEGAGYAFKDGTSNRQIRAATCNLNGDLARQDDKADTGNKGDKSRCAARRPNGRFKIKCNYSQPEFDALRGK
ncbi:MAG: hypothetical protein KDJ99_03550 [Candidatus Competibacteraceae bacterium]|nr:hypothetical protein [Candidatus Competibacteraceae bacterium]